MFHLCSNVTYWYNCTNFYFKKLEYLKSTLDLLNVTMTRERTVYYAMSYVLYITPNPPPSPIADDVCTIY